MTFPVTSSFSYLRHPSSSCRLLALVLCCEVAVRQFGCALCFTHPALSLTAHKRGCGALTSLSCPTPAPRVVLPMAAGGKGFGKSDPLPSKTKVEKNPDDDAPVQNDPPATPLQSISSMREVDDDGVPVEERTSKILREKYGMRSYEEKQTEVKSTAFAQKFNELKTKGDGDGKDIDFFALIPAPLLVAIDSFLKLGLGICIVLFVAAGIAIAVEAWSHASGGALPENVDNFIVNTVEPNFTPGLAVLFGFSVSLGVFSAAQLGSASSQYSEDP